MQDQSLSVSDGSWHLRMDVLWKFWTLTCKVFGWGYFPCSAVGCKSQRLVLWKEELPRKLFFFFLCRIFIESNLVKQAVDTKAELSCICRPPTWGFRRLVTPWCGNLVVWWCLQPAKRASVLPPDDTSPAAHSLVPCIVPAKESDSMRHTHLRRTPLVHV